MRRRMPFIACPAAAGGGACGVSAWVLAMLAALCWGLAPVAGKVGLTAVDPVVGLALRTLMASALVLGFVVGSGAWARLEQVPVASWLPIGVEALLATLAGDLAYYAALKRGDASVVAAVMAASPLATVTAASLWLGEPVTRDVVLGSLLIAAGVALLGRAMGD